MEAKDDEVVHSHLIFRHCSATWTCARQSNTRYLGMGSCSRPVADVATLKLQQ